MSNVPTDVQNGASQTTSENFIHDNSDSNHKSDVKSLSSENKNCASNDSPPEVELNQLKGLATELPTDLELSQTRQTEDDVFETPDEEFALNSIDNKVKKMGLEDETSIKLVPKNENEPLNLIEMETSQLQDQETENNVSKDLERQRYEAEMQVLPKRYVLLLMMFLGFAVIYSLRVNINVAIVAMVNNRTRLTSSGKIVTHIAEFNWNSHEQGLVLGSFYYGYWVLQVPGAWIAIKLGATRIFGYGTLLASLLALLTPVATRYHVYALAGVRMVQGLFLGVTYPCVIAICAKWSPPLERSTMVTMAIAGSPVGNIIAIPLTGLLAKYGADGGWPTVFYFFGFFGIAWYMLWEFIIYDSPSNHPNISEKEKMYIERSIGEKPFDPMVESPPWKAIFTSLPMWGIIFGHFGACWGYYTLFTQMPTYLKDIQHLDLKTMGLVAATPYLFKAFLGPLGGISADILVKQGYLSVRGVRTLFYGLGCILAGFFILMVGYYQRKGEAIAFLILGVGFSGLNATGYAVNHLDLAPRYAGVLMGITNSFATIPGFLSPFVTGHITKNKKPSEWKIVFWITFIVYVVAVGLYTVLCSGEKQWWADGYQDENENTVSPKNATDEDNPDSSDKPNNDMIKNTEQESNDKEEKEAKSPT